MNRLLAGSVKWVMIVMSLFASANALAENIQIVGVGGHMLTLKDKKWSRPAPESAVASFTANGKTFPLYISDVGTETHDSWLSPDKKTVLLLQTLYGVVIGQEGEEIPTEETGCGVISMETGCVLSEHVARFCDGTWEGNRWASGEGEVLDLALTTPSPKDFLNQVSSIEMPQSRVEELEFNLRIISPDAYMACHPPARNVQALNDLAFYLAEGGNDELALKFYRGVEAVGKRTVLMLNIADSLWRLDRKDEAQRYYSQYRDAMSADGKAQKIPQRAVERSVIQGMKH
ncbi:type IV pilus biogenesis/stability protein PilW [Pseudomonas sp. HS6]|uniref:tetratricopeptide repeat protein n=1 Tax=Pseudomonas sp. HS6 TaxID=2850559 RepID=UPI0020199340|nr:tetratricopeptide repeat protein [Pseudomonas sp. HS6]UQS13380.1 tetratricopeptide repeat protein [Pseudomonas sp. HS6]